MAHVAGTATAPFRIDSWEEEAISDVDGRRLCRTHLTKRFSGDLEASSEGEMTMAYVGGQPAAYCGFERVSGTLQGLSGSFLFHHDAVSGEAGSLSLTVVDGSGTGELEKLSGSARIEMTPDGAHTLLFDYTIG